jgi:hypothetical protein
MARSAPSGVLARFQAIPSFALYFYFFSIFLFPFGHASKDTVLNQSRTTESLASRWHEMQKLWLDA